MKDQGVVIDESNTNLSEVPPLIGSIIVANETNKIDFLSTVKSYVVTSVADNIGRISDGCLIEIYGVMRRHGVNMVESDDQFLNTFVNSKVMDDMNIVEGSPNQVLISDWMKSSRNLTIEGLFCGHISGIALTDLIALSCYMVENGNAFAWGEDNSDRKTRIFGCFDKQRCRVNVMNKIRFHHMNSDHDGIIIQQAAFRKHLDIIDCGILQIPLNQQFLQPIREVIEQVNTLMGGQYVSFENLEIIQLNLHNGELFLPSHYDEVAHDGFGKIIVTVAIKGTADIVIVDYFKEGKPSYSFSLAEGDLYVLYEHVRTFCTHGVVGTNVTPVLCNLPDRRVSFNLRFKMHRREEMNKINKIWSLDTEESLKPGMIESLRNVERNYEPETGDIRYVEAVFIPGKGVGIVAIRDICGSGISIGNNEADKITSLDEMENRCLTSDKIHEDFKENVWWDGNNKHSIGPLINHACEHMSNCIIHFDPNNGGMPYVVTKKSIMKGEEVTLTYNLDINNPDLQSTKFDWYRRAIELCSTCNTPK